MLGGRKRRQTATVAAHVTARVSDAVFGVLQERADAAGVTVSAYTRKLVEWAVLDELTPAMQERMRILGEVVQRSALLRVGHGLLTEGEDFEMTDEDLEELERECAAKVWITYTRRKLLLEREGGLA